MKSQVIVSVPVVSAARVLTLPEPGVARTWHVVDAGADLLAVVPRWYRSAVAMNLRLTDEETEALRRRAEQEGRSMQDVAREAIRQYTAGRQERLAGAIERIRTEDAELLDRLSK
jgi:hypothetical protein